jgi:Tol biopolymer transport system component
MQDFFRFIGIALIAAVCQQSSSASTAPAFYQNARQITFTGPRAGEGYFNNDGTKMIFQSEREPGNPFYQIYVKDFKTGETKRVSNGAGKTTCSWLHPDGERALYASTHLDPTWKAKAKKELEMRAKGEKPKYAWSYDDQFDLYETNLKSGKAKALAPAVGYDAEGDYSPDGKWIVFSSNRLAYSEKLNREDSKRRDEDPSYFLEIYLMRADGTGLKRLTDVAGYDGGPFFSKDGAKIIWRRFTPDGHTAEVWTMSADGSEQKQITKLKAMSWAPYFHPSGDYIIFTTNVWGHDNFELYMVDSDGRHEPVRVTDWSGFDGLPVFTPDGQGLAWTHRNEKGESQIYMAQWNDVAARQALGLAVKAIEPGLGSPEIRTSDMREWVGYLASSDMKGRASGSIEEGQYTTLIAKRMGDMGLKPWLKTGFRQPFEFQMGVKLLSDNEIRVQQDGVEIKPLPLGKSWVPTSFSPSGDYASAPITFAGFGIVAPASSSQPAYDSYRGLDVKGHWVMVLPDLPSDISNERRFHLNIYAHLQHKALVAQQRGALGLIVINPAAELKLKYSGSSGSTAIPIIELTEAAARSWVPSSGRELKSWRETLDKGEVGGGLLKGLQLSARIQLEAEKAQAHNVVGVIRVPGATETILIGAHGDHLGLGERGNTLQRADERGSPHYGADDNASGVAVVLELAHALADQIREGAWRPKTNLAFAVWSGEELGNLGSSHFIKNLGREKIRAYLNLDMVGRLRETLMIQGVASAKEWVSLLEPMALKSPTAFSLQEDPYLPTDALAFYVQKIPILSFFTGAHAEYHTPRDRVELINFPGMLDVAEVVKNVVKTASSTSRLTYNKVEGGHSPTAGRGFRLYLGTIPDYTVEGIAGVKISGTSKLSPAEKAGLQTGDIIIELGGTKVTNLQDYVYCLQSMKADVKTPIKVMRQGQVVELSIVPVLKGM